MAHKIGQLSITPEKSNAIGKVFLSQPEMEEERLLGKIFVILEIKNKKKENIALANFIIERLLINYYQNEQVELLDKMATVTVEQIFESALSRLNTELVQFIKDNKIKFSADTLDLTLGCLHRSKIIFTNHGRNSALMIYKPQSSDRPNEEYELINVSKQTASSQKKIFNINKFFSDTIVGKIPPEAFFLITNEALSEYLSEKQIKKIITTLPPAGAVQQIQNVLEKNIIQVPFLALLIQNHRVIANKPQSTIRPKVKEHHSTVAHQIESSKERMKIGPEKDPNKESIRALNRTEEQTDHILRPKGLINLKKLKHQALSLIAAVKPKQKSKQLLKLTHRAFAKRQPKISLKKLFKNLKQGLFYAINAAIAIWHFAAKKQNRQALAAKSKSFYQKIKPIHLVLAGFAILAIGGLTWGLMSAKEDGQTATMQAEFREQQTAIEQVQNQLEASMIYDNKQKALQLLTDLKAKLDNLPRENEEQTAYYQTINDYYKEKYYSLNGIDYLSQPDEVAAFSEADNLSGLNLVDNRLIFSDNQSGEIFRLNPENKQVSRISQETALLDTIFFSATDQNSAYYLGDSQAIAVGSDGYAAYSINNLPENITAMATYSQRLYLFDNDSKQILRYSRSGRTYASPYNWLSSPSAETAKDLAIDGFVYLLTDSNVLKYGNGRLQNFKLEEIEPALTSAGHLHTTADMDKLLVGEAKNGRLLVFDKSGKLLKQYMSDAFKDLRDIAYDQANNIVYLLSGDTIYKIELEQ